MAEFRLPGNGGQGRVAEDITAMREFDLSKPPAGRFARYAYREDLFPSVVFRRAYDAIQTPHHGERGDLEYLRILHLAASTMEADVDGALSLLLAEGELASANSVEALVATAPCLAQRLLAAQRDVRLEKR